MYERQCQKPHLAFRQGRLKNNDNLHFSTEILKYPNHNPIFSTNHLEAISSYQSKGVIFVLLTNIRKFWERSFVWFTFGGTYTTTVYTVRTDLHISIEWLGKKASSWKADCTFFPSLVFCCWEDSSVWLSACECSVKPVRGTIKIPESSSTNRGLLKASCQV